MSYNFLDKDGLSYFWSKIKAKLNDIKSSQITDKINNTAAGNNGWTSQTNDNKVITNNTLAYWNGAYTGTTSNLEYVKAGKITDLLAAKVNTSDMAKYNYSTGDIASGTIDDLAAYTSGKPGITGSISIQPKASGIGSEIPAGWYNYFFAPHRSGANTSGGDSHKYGAIILTPMSFSGKSWILRRSGSTNSITEVKELITPDNIYEAYFKWGGKNIAADVSPNDMGCIDEFGHNKLAFLPASCIDVAYSTDGGTTWVDYGLTDTQKVAMVTTSGPGVTTGGSATATANNVVNHKLRVRIACGTVSGSLKLYTSAKKFLLNISNNGASATVTIRRRSIANYMSDTDTWTNVGTYNIAGGSGWNSIPFIMSFGGNMQNQTSQVGQVEFVFNNLSLGTWSSKKTSLFDIRLIGSTNWACPSEIARAGHLYTMDTSQNATFPANITATTFVGNVTGNVTGNLSGNATTATKATQDSDGNAINTTYVKKSADGMSAGINQLSTGSSTPTDNDYYVSQYVGGGTTTTSYHRRPMSALWEYIKSKINADGYTKNTGTVTSVAVKMNNTTKGTVTTSGTIDLGTVITSHQDISGLAPKASPTFTGTPKAPTATAGTNTTQIATTAFVQTAVSGKVDKETGKGLSTNDYTTTEKTKLAGIATGATANTGTVTSVAVKMNGSTKGTVTTSGTIDLGTVITTVDDELDSSVSATNPVQNWVISSAIDALDGEISETYESIPQIIYSRLNSATISSATIDSIVNGTYGS